MRTFTSIYIEVTTMILSPQYRFSIEIRPHLRPRPQSEALTME
tara:strand:- start:1518 stop:1646 length:129 start_codon:yes stop_codon:yes gene_type:complete